MSWTLKRETQFLDALYLGVRDRTGFDSSLDLLGDIFDVKTCILFDFDSARPEIATQASTGIFRGEVLARYHREFLHLDPAPRAYMATPPGKAIPTYRLLPEEKRRPGVFFNEFFRPVGLEECLGGTLASNKGRFAMVGLQRPPDRKAFDDDDIARLEALMPHLARALQLRRSLVDLEATTMALSEICDRLAAGIAVLDEHGRGLFTNAAARRMASAGDGLSMDRIGRLFPANREAAKRIAELEADVRAGGAGGMVRVPRPDGKPSYMTTVAPYVVDRSDNAGASRPRGVIFVVHDPLAGKKSSTDTVMRLLGLPRATAKVVAALLADDDPRAFAESAGVSINTVRYHLKTAYARTGVRGQSELVRLVSTALRDIADHRPDQNAKDSE